MITEMRIVDRSSPSLALNALTTGRTQVVTSPGAFERIIISIGWIVFMMFKLGLGNVFLVMMPLHLIFDRKHYNRFEGKIKLGARSNNPLGILRRYQISAKSMNKIKI